MGSEARERTRSDFTKERRRQGRGRGTARARAAAAFDHFFQFRALFKSTKKGVRKARRGEGVREKENNTSTWVRVVSENQ